MVRAPNFGLRTHLALSVPLPTQLMCNLATANLMLRASWRWTIVPSNGWYSGPLGSYAHFTLLSLTTVCGHFLSF